MEQDLILTTFSRPNVDKPKAAEMLGISLKTLCNWAVLSMMAEWSEQFAKYVTFEIW